MSSTQPSLIIMPSIQGVVQQSIKDVNQSLVDDNLICSDKIGSGVFFWSFPSKAYQDLLQTEERLKATLSASKESIEKTEREITELAENRQRPDRGRLLEQLTRLQEEEKLLDRELESLKSFDPEHIEKVLKEAKRCKVSADRWTDNVWLIRAYMTRKLGRSSKEVIRLCVHFPSFLLMLSSSFSGRPVFAHRFKL